MIYFQLVITRFGGPGAYTGGMSDLALSEVDGRLRVYSVNGAPGGILTWDPAQDLAVTGSWAGMPLSQGARLAVAGLETLHLGGQEALIALGQGSGAQGFWLGGSASLTPAFRLPIAQTLLAATAMALADGRDVVFTSSLQSLGVTSWLRQSDGTLQPLQHLTCGNAQLGYDLLDMQVLARPGTPLLLAVSAQSNSLAAFCIGSDGRLVLADTLAAGEGFAVTAPNLLATARLAGRDYALVGAAGSGSISVAALAADGHMQLVDQVLDDLGSRFQGISVLKTASLDGRVFVLAGGADDGLSLMTLLPNGRLLLLETIVDGLTTALQDVSAACMVARNGGLDVFATGWSESGLSQFRIDPGRLAPILTASGAGGALVGDDRSDLLWGGNGDDQIYGGGGRDIVLDGPGKDRMYGGAAADTFILVADGVVDEIGDFNPAEDRLDLSGLGRIYARDAISFSALTGGIALSVAGETILLFSSDGMAILPDMLTDARLFGLSHTGIWAMAHLARKLIGSNLADMLMGKAGNDQLYGGAGDDSLAGGAGNDSLYAGPGNDVIDGGPGLDRAYLLGSGNVVVDLSLTASQHTGQGLDTLVRVENLSSGSGNDRLSGNILANDITAGAGNDTLIGGGGDDSLYGGVGDDLLRGEVGSNMLFGGAGADTFVFSKAAAGVNWVADLERRDHVALQGFGYATAAEAVHHLHQSAGDVIFADQGLTIRFADTTLADLAADMLVI